MVIMDGRRRRSSSRIVNNATSLIDIFPTIMDLAGVAEEERPRGLDGSSLLPFVGDGDGGDDGEVERPPFVVSQFHGECGREGGGEGDRNQELSKSRLSHTSAR